MQSDALKCLATLILIACAGCTSAEPDATHGSSGASGATSTSTSTSTSTTGVGGAGGGGGSDAGAGGDGGAREGVVALFIGNSYTYVNALPARVRNLADTAGVPPNVDVAQ